MSNKALTRKYNEELSKDLMGKVYKAFAYIFETVDSKLLALKDISPKSSYARDDKFALFSDETSHIKSYTARTFVFANGNRITVTLSPGKLEKGLLQQCPYLSFKEHDNQREIRTLTVEPHYGVGSVTVISGGGVKLISDRVVLKDIKYPATGAEILTDQFKEEFNKTFSKIIELALTDSFVK